MTGVPKSLVLRARMSSHSQSTNFLSQDCITETRKTYRAVLSEPTLVIPAEPSPSLQLSVAADTVGPQTDIGGGPLPSSFAPTQGSIDDIRNTGPKKRPREDGEVEAEPSLSGARLGGSQEGGGEPRKKKKRKKDKGISATM